MCKEEDRKYKSFAISRQFGDYYETVIDNLVERNVQNLNEQVQGGKGWKKSEFAIFNQSWGLL